MWRLGAGEWLWQDETVLFHELRRAALEDVSEAVMASDVRAASENGTVIDATEMLAFAWSTMGPDARKVLSRQYITENPHPEGERYKLDAVDDNSYYARDHRAFHDWAKRFREHFGYYDVFLISPAGDLIYTVAKESDFATNLKTGPYRKSPLADVFRRDRRQSCRSRDHLGFRALSPERQRSCCLRRSRRREGRQGHWCLRRVDSGGAAERADALHGGDG